MTDITNSSPHPRETVGFLLTLLSGLFLGSSRRNARGTFGDAQGTPEPIAKDKDLSIVVNVVGVVDCMVLAAHDGINVPIHGIMNVGRPNSGEK